MKNPLASVAKKITSKAVDGTCEGIKQEVSERADAVKDRLLSDDILPILVAGGILLIGLAIARKPQPTVVKVVIKQV